MLPMECVAPTVEDAGVAFDHGVEAIQTASASLDFKHVPLLCTVRQACRSAKECRSEARATDAI